MKPHKNPFLLLATYNLHNTSSAIHLHILPEGRSVRGTSLKEKHILYLRREKLFIQLSWSDKHLTVSIIAMRSLSSYQVTLPKYCSAVRENLSLSSDISWRSDFVRFKKIFHQDLRILGSNSPFSRHIGWPAILNSGRYQQKSCLREPAMKWVIKDGGRWC